MPSKQVEDVYEVRKWLGDERRSGDYTCDRLVAQGGSDGAPSLAVSIKSCTAQIVVDAAINEGLTLQNQQAFSKDARSWSEERVAREFGAKALDHFRAIRRHKAELMMIIKKEG